MWSSSTAGNREREKEIDRWTERERGREKDNNRGRERGKQTNF